MSIVNSKQWVHIGPRPMQLVVVSAVMAAVIMADTICQILIHASLDSFFIL